MKDIVLRQLKNLEKFNTAIFLVLDDAKIHPDLRVQLEKDVFLTISKSININNSEEGSVNIKDNIKDILKLIDSVMSYIEFLNKTKRIDDQKFALLADARVYIKDKFIECLSIIKDTSKNESLLRDMKNEDLLISSVASESHKKIENSSHYSKSYHSTKQVKKNTHINIRSPFTGFTENDRKAQILKILTNVPISIRDISSKIQGCSEKTIQRELNTLVDLKKVSKFGEKRWSKYALYVS